MQHVRDRKGGTYTPKQIEFVEALPHRRRQGR